jgi:hypothetical protein
MDMARATLPKNHHGAILLNSTSSSTSRIGSWPGIRAASAFFQRP